MSLRRVPVSDTAQPKAPTGAGAAEVVAVKFPMKRVLSMLGVIWQWQPSEFNSSWKSLREMYFFFAPPSQLRGESGLGLRFGHQLFQSSLGRFDGVVDGLWAIEPLLLRQCLLGDICLLYFCEAKNDISQLVDC